MEIKPSKKQDAEWVFVGNDAIEMKTPIGVASITANIVEMFPKYKLVFLEYEHVSDNITECKEFFSKCLAQKGDEIIALIAELNQNNK